MPILKFCKESRGRNILALSFFLALSGCLSVDTANGAAPQIWTASSLVRIGQNNPAMVSDQIELSAAKDETYSFQIGIHAPASGLTGVKVTTAGLTGPNSFPISGRDIALFREQYVYVPVSPQSQKGSNPPGPAGWYPDGLIPFVDPETGQQPQGGVLRAVPFDVPAGTNQVVWVDVHVPPAAPAGLYSGTVLVSSNQGGAAVRVELHVWNFTMPKVPSFKTAYQANPSHQNLYMTHELLRNRVSPEWDNPAEEADLIRNWGLNATNTWFSSGLGVGNCASTSMPPAPSIAQFKAVAAQHQPGILLYNFSADEIARCPNVFGPLKGWAARMHAAGIKNMVTVPPTAGLMDDGSGHGRSAVDIWVVLPEQYDQAKSQVAAVLAKGDSVWSYNVLVQDGYSPKNEINFSPLDYRLNMGFISQSLGLSGFQQWSVDNWTSDPWNDVTGSMQVPSDGILVYPGQDVGILGYAPSMRLKWTRDGIDDFEYVQILKSLGQGAWALAEARTVGPDWTNWTRDYKQVEAVRLALGNRIDQLSRRNSGAASR